MDSALKDILATVALRAALYFRTDFRPPFGVMVPAFAKVARFHLLIKGRCTIVAGNGPAVTLEQGDLVLVPNGSKHLISSGSETTVLPLDDAFVAAGYRGTGPFVLGDGDASQSCQLICGHFEYSHGADHPLFRKLPEIIHIRNDARSVRPLFDDLVAMLERRLFEEEAQTFASINRLSEALFIEILEAAVDQSQELGALMEAMRDPKIGRVIALIHENVEQDWSVDSLAQSAAMSRTRFAERFQRLVGMAPMAYVGEWRMQRAFQLVRDTQIPIKSIAHRSGYASAAAFSRAFAKRFGEAPDRTRRKGDGRTRA